MMLVLLDLLFEATWIGGVALFNTTLILSLPRPYRRLVKQRPWIKTLERVAGFAIVLPMIYMCARFVTDGTMREVDYFAVLLGLFSAVTALSIALAHYRWVAGRTGRTGEGLSPKL